jgi:hypothetical protein
MVPPTMLLTRSLLQASACSCEVRALAGRACVLLLLWWAACLPAAAQTVRLAWDPPVSGPDVSYVIQYGTTPGVYPHEVPVGFRITRHDVTGLAPGTYYFVVRALDSRGASSSFSATTTATVEGDVSTDEGPSDGLTRDPIDSTRTIVSVSASQQLQSVIDAATPRTTVLLEPGTYALAESIAITDAMDLEIRGRTGRRSDVTLLAPPDEVSPLFIVTRTWALKVADLTIQSGKSLAFDFGDGAQWPHLTRLHMIGGGAFVRSALHADGSGTREGLVSNCRFEVPGIAGTLPVAIEVQRGFGWVVRGSRFTYATLPSGELPGAGVLAWQGSQHTLVERNVFVGGAREIVFGLAPRSPDQHVGGLIRNNMIARIATAGARGPAISVADAPRAVVAHNSVLVAGTSAVAIEYAHPDTRGGEIVNNLLDAVISVRDRADARRRGNARAATPGMFRDAARGDLHLVVEAAAIALRRGVATTHAPLDVDGDERPVGVRPDIGADQVIR